MATGDFTFNVSVEVLSVMLVGCTVEVSKFPCLPGMPSIPCSKPGLYKVESVVVHADRSFEIGFADEKDTGMVDYYWSDEVQLRVVKPGVFFGGHVREGGAPVNG